VSEKTQSVIDGLKAAGVAASVKHFPGLGEVVGNTDFASGIVDGRHRCEQPVTGPVPLRGTGWGGFDNDLLGPLFEDRSSQPGSLLGQGDRPGRGWGYQGVVISDDLGAAASVRSIPAGQRAVRFVAAGGDVVIDADPSLVPAMAKALLAKAAKEPAFAKRITESAARVLALKQDLGTFTCG